MLSATYTIVNKCDRTVWPGILSNSDSAQLSTTGFTLQKGESKTITVPSSWGGRFWGRTHCTQDSTGKFSCVTGDCGSGKLECAGGGAAPPATLAEFKLNGYGGLDFYDVSLVDGYNLPLMVVPQGGTGGNCTKTGCEVDLNGACPSELKVTSTDGKENVACKSACEAFREPQYCCSGAYATPDKCTPSSYSQLFKSACPCAYSYAYDDSTSTFTCAGADYMITFCPSPKTRYHRLPFLAVSLFFLNQGHFRPNIFYKTGQNKRLISLHGFAFFMLPKNLFRQLFGVSNFLAMHLCGYLIILSTTSTDSCAIFNEMS